MAMSIDVTGTTDLSCVDVNTRIDYVTVTVSPALIQLMIRIVKSFLPEKVCVCVCACMRACVRACMRACVRVCVCCL